MAEKGILVSDAITGESVACRDAVELDNDSNARVIQRVDVTKGPLPDSFRSSSYLIRDGITSDSADVSTWSAGGVFTNLITVGDKSTLVVQVEVTSYSTTTANIVPVLMDSAGTTVQGQLAQQGITFEACQGQIQISSGHYCAPLLTWDVTGASKIALVLLDASDSYVDFDIYGAVI